MIDLLVWALGLVPFDIPPYGPTPTPGVQPQGGNGFAAYIVGGFFGLGIIIVAMILLSLKPRRAQPPRVYRPVSTGSSAAPTSTDSALTATAVMIDQIRQPFRVSSTPDRTITAKITRPSTIDHPALGRHQLDRARPAQDQSPEHGMGDQVDRHRERNRSSPPRAPGRGIRTPGPAQRRERGQVGGHLDDAGQRERDRKPVPPQQRGVCGQHATQSAPSPAPGRRHARDGRSLLSADRGLEPRSPSPCSGLIIFGVLHNVLEIRYVAGRFAAILTGRFLALLLLLTTGIAACRLTAAAWPHGARLRRGRRRLPDPGRRVLDRAAGPAGWPSAWRCSPWRAGSLALLPGLPLRGAHPPAQPGAAGLPVGLGAPDAAGARRAGLPAHPGALDPRRPAGVLAGVARPLDRADPGVVQRFVGDGARVIAGAAPPDAAAQSGSGSWSSSPSCRPCTTWSGSASCPVRPRGRRGVRRPGAVAARPPGLGGRHRSAARSWPCCSSATTSRAGPCTARWPPTTPTWSSRCCWLC